ncbi:MAG: UDP-N-acetylmuramate--L-alanine ligase [Nitrospirae bacterium]|nr:UDP-N-acetylmuramate--L-alanine ligase [Nitrospirota bacterium]
MSELAGATDTAYPRIRRVHMIGVGGSGMSGIAEVLLTHGYDVSGSDAKWTSVTERLEKMGVKVSIGHQAENVKDVDVVVFSSAVAPDNPEVSEARQRGIPVIPRAEMLAEVMRMKYGILVAGAHGKTTTTSLLAHLLTEAKFDPTVVIGGRFLSWGGGAKPGRGKFVVAEADESDGSFLKLSPTIAVVTNVDREHMNHYRTMGRLKTAFLEFMNKVPFFGLCVVCTENPILRKLRPKIQRRVVTYGCKPKGDSWARKITFDGGRSSFEVMLGKESLGPFEVPLIGYHNVLNSLGALATARELGIPVETARAALKTFPGVHRRFEVKGVHHDVMIVDDYGHHPQEIRVTLRAARESWPKRRLVVAFQPHRYSRTQDLFEEFMVSFGDAHELFVADIYSAGETAIEGVHASKLVEGLKAKGFDRAHYHADRRQMTEEIARLLRPGDLFLTLGAGDIWMVAEEIIHRLTQEGEQARVA